MGKNECEERWELRGKRRETVKEILVGRKNNQAAKIALKKGFKIQKCKPYWILNYKELYTRRWQGLLNQLR